MAIRVGLFGAGWAAGMVHGPSLRDYRRRRGGIALAGVCDIDPGRAEKIREEFGFEQSYSSVRRMLTAARLDAAVVAVSASQNARVARTCLVAGVPVLLEKPPAMSRRSALALARTVKVMRGRAMVAFNRRWAPVLVRLRELLARRGGRIHSVGCRFRRVRRRDADFSITAIHAVDTLRFLAGSDYRSLDIAYGRCGPRGRATSYHALGTMVSGAAAALDIVPMAGMNMEEYTVHAGGETFVADVDYGDIPGTIATWSGGRRRDVAVRVPSAARHDVSGFYQETAAFLDAIRRRGRLPGPTVAGSVQSVEVMEALRRGRRKFRRR